MITFGVDPGKTGAVATLRNGKLLQVISTPVEKTTSGKNAYAEFEMRGLIVGQLWNPERPEQVLAGIEVQQAYPQQGGVSNFSTGDGYGLWRGILIGIGIAPKKMTVKEWRDVIFTKRELDSCIIHEKPNRKTKLTGKQKAENKKARKALMVRKAIAIFPSHKHIIGPDDGKAEAILIGVAAQRIYGV